MLARILHRFGYVRLKDYGYMLTAAGKIVEIDLVLPTSPPAPRWQAALPAERLIPPRIQPVVVPPPAITILPPPVVAEPNDDDEWEWHMALARARERAAADEQAVARVLAAPIPPSPAAPDIASALRQAVAAPRSVEIAQSYANLLAGGPAEAEPEPDDDEWEWTIAMARARRFKTEPVPRRPAPTAAPRTTVVAVAPAPRAPEPATRAAAPAPTRAAAPAPNAPTRAAAPAPTRAARAPLPLAAPAPIPTPHAAATAAPTPAPAVRPTRRTMPMPLVADRPPAAPVTTRPATQRPDPSLPIARRRAPTGQPFAAATRETTYAFPSKKPVTQVRATATALTRPSVLPPSERTGRRTLVGEPVVERSRLARGSEPPPHGREPAAARAVVRTVPRRSTLRDLPDVASIRDRLGYDPFDGPTREVPNPLLAEAEAFEKQTAEYPRAPAASPRDREPTGSTTVADGSGPHDIVLLVPKVPPPPTDSAIVTFVAPLARPRFRTERPDRTPLPRLTSRLGAKPTAR